MPAETTAKHYLLLQLIARIYLDPSYTDQLDRLRTQDVDWERFILEAESHGLSPLAYKYLIDARGVAPPETLDKLLALYLRHKSSIGIRTGAVMEIVDRLEDEGVPVVLLKGIALAHLIYPDAGLRPMSDIDILVASNQKHRAFGLLKQLGYMRYGDHELRTDHHHLPTLSKPVSGLLVSVEIHDDAIAPDNIGSIRLDNLVEAPQDILLEQNTARCLGHIDMIRHLCRHTLEPRRVTKLGSVLDTLGYVKCFADTIDWPRLRKDFPHTLTTLKYFGYLLSWPPQLDRYAPGPKPPGPNGVGIGMSPLSRIRDQGKMFSHLLNPSDWWLRAYYGVPESQTLTYTKAIRHPWQLALWGWRRFRS